MGNIDDWEEMIDTNVKGLLYVTRAVVPGMVERGRGHVINLGSVAGEMTYPNGAVYCASKAAERAINDGLRQDVLGTPIRVTSVDPGMVETDFSLVRFHGDTGARREGLQEHQAADPGGCCRCYRLGRDPA
jgi:3-hydroxy acid dehydrogenase/malonic semialdehyde reductase